jgi:L-alanine-DL-glutamate epimerase-like enolase superfamily enzyme
LIVDGAISVPEQPGLGIELDTDVLGQKLARNETLSALLQ